MTLPPAEHPIWKVLQGLISLAGLAILAFHGVDGAHHGGIDMEDGAGAAGLLIAGRLAWHTIRAK